METNRFNVRTLLLRATLFLALVFTVGLGLFTQTADVKANIYNLPRLDVVSEKSNYKIDSKYIFVPQFTSETELKVTSKHGTWQTLPFSRDTSVPGHDRQFKSIDLYAYGTNPRGRENAKFNAGDIEARYTNVGTYGGKKIDLRIIVEDWQRQSNHGSKEKNFLSFQTDAIALATQVNQWTDMTWRFVESGTNKSVNVAGYMTFADIDAHQGLQFSTPSSQNIDRFLLQNRNSNLKYTNAGTSSSPRYRVYYPNATDVDDEVYNSRHAITFLYNRSAFRFQWRWDHPNGGRGTNLNNDAARGEYLFYVMNKPAPTKIPKPKKTVNKTTLGNADTSITYTVRHDVPAESSSYYYSSYKITDELDTTLKNPTVTIRDSGGRDRSSWFTTKISGRTITATAKSAELKKSRFYNREYVMTIKADVDGDALMSKFGSKSTYDIKNKATVTVNGNPNHTNEVKTVVPKPPDLVTPTKKVNKAKVTDETLRYTIEHRVPTRPVRHYYKSYTITDTFDDVINNIRASDVTITDTNGNNRSSWFDVTTSGRTLTVKAKSSRLATSAFYNKTYRIQVDTVVNADRAKQKVRSDRPYDIENVARVTADGTSKVTKRVVTEIPPQVPHETPEKTVTTYQGDAEQESTILPEQPFVYDVTHKVGKEIPLFYFNEYEIRDKVDERLDISHVEIFDKNDANVTNRFTININNSNNTISAKAKTSALGNASFYDDEYRLQIVVRAGDMDRLFNDLNGDGRTAVTNDATVTRDGESKRSSQTVTSIFAPTLTFGIEQIEIYTNPEDKGLPVDVSISSHFDEEQTFVKVLSSTLAVRRGPSTSHDMIHSSSYIRPHNTAGHLSYYRLLDVDDDTGWYLIDSPFGVGWVSNGPSFTKLYSQPTGIGQVKIRANTLAVRTGPGTTYPLLNPSFRARSSDDPYEIIAVDPDTGWYMIETEHGAGWVSGSASNTTELDPITPESIRNIYSRGYITVNLFKGSSGTNVQSAGLSSASFDLESGGEGSHVAEMLVPASYLTKGDVSDYRAELSVQWWMGQDRSQHISVDNDRRDIVSEGHVSKEDVLSYDPSGAGAPTPDGNGKINLSFNGVAKTLRKQGQPIVRTNERVNLSFDALQRTKSGYRYNPTAGLEVRYRNTLTSYLSNRFGAEGWVDRLTVESRVDSRVVEPSLDLDTDGGRSIVPTERKVSGGNTADVRSSYFGPKVHIDRESGDLVLGEGGTQAHDVLLVPVWLDELRDDYVLGAMSSNGLGSHRTRVDVDALLDVYAYMFSHVDSDTIDEDELLITPVESSELSDDW